MEESILPKHIGIIMDGNRRWAKAKGKLAISGHSEGANTLEKILRYANKIGIKYLTVYAFSTENWKRTEGEINGLMELLQKYLDDFSKRADTENIKVKVLGDISKLSPRLQEGIKKTIARTKNNTGITFNVAVNYGGRDEIKKAVKEIAEEARENKIKIEDITEEMISNHLYTKEQPDPDLIIRTSGEMRLSGFLTWQSTYSEFYFLNKHWPDFTEKDLDIAIEEYSRRNRKFGGK